jgi:hypothetical protein
MPWLVFPWSFWSWVVRGSKVRDQVIVGKLPLATVGTDGITATWNTDTQLVTLTSVNRSFIDASRRHQQNRRPAQ